MEKVFDEDEPGRAAAGAKLVGLYRSVSNPNDVTLVFEAPDAGVFDTLMSDPKDKTTFRKPE